MNTPEAEVRVDEALVRALLEAQHPDLAHLPLRAVSSGWDNAMLRLGDELAVRLPRRAVAAPAADKEIRWLPALAPRLPLPVPAPVRVGEPGAAFPWRWTIVPWTEGLPADLDPPRADQAPALAGFLRALHQPAPEDAPRNPFRGVPLAERRAGVEERARTLASWPVRAWEEALAAPGAVERCWLHGDLHPRNVLVRDGLLASILDWGDLGAGDPATDLAAAWMLFEDVEVLLDAYGAGEALVARARGWAVVFGVLLATIDDSPHYRAVGRETLRRVSALPGARRPRGLE